jgi:hypothetical protein
VPHVGGYWIRGSKLPPAAAIDGKISHGPHGLDSHFVKFWTGLASGAMTPVEGLEPGWSALGPAAIQDHLARVCCLIFWILTLLDIFSKYTYVKFYTVFRGARLFACEPRPRLLHHSTSGFVVGHGSVTPISHNSFSFLQCGRDTAFFGDLGVFAGDLRRRIAAMTVTVSRTELAQRTAKALFPPQGKKG